MTDLERAVSMVGAWEYATSYDPHVRVTQICEALAAARREGAEEMRERAARMLDEQGNELYDEKARYRDAGWIGLNGYDRRIEWHRDAAKALRALPLTPEEPT